MRTLGVVALTLIAGSAVQAQAVKPADLVGRWVEVGDTSGTSGEFRADSTFTLLLVLRPPPGAIPPNAPPVPDVTMTITGLWSLAADTLTIISEKAVAKDPTGEHNMPIPPANARDRQLVKIEGTRLTAIPLKPNQPTKVYERRDLPPATQRSGSTVPDTARPPKP